MAASVDALPEPVDVLPELADEFLLEATVAKPELNPSTISLNELAMVETWAGVLAIAGGRAGDPMLI
jgi:hypothetical protein